MYHRNSRRIQRKLRFRMHNRPCQRNVDNSFISTNIARDLTGSLVHSWYFHWKIL